MIEFNVNDCVQVRITERGWGHLRTTAYPMSLVHDVGEGWSEWQAWELMRVFGPVLGNGIPPPFHPNIRILTYRGN